MKNISTQLKLLTPISLGQISLANRLVMAPLTRMRAASGDICNPHAKTYYSQRAGAGLIITEATQVSSLGKGYPATPGIYNEAQTSSWKVVVDAVHEHGGKIVAQLWHVGRISHSSLHQEDGLPIAPSPIAVSGKTMAADWKGVLYETPREMTQSDIELVIDQYYRAAINAKKAGFDGIEIHAANGYLLDQFLQDKTNHRKDHFGGSFENRMRLLNLVLTKVGEVFSYQKIGVRLSPYGTFNEIGDSDPIGLFSYVINQLNKYKLAYLHLIEPRATSAGGSDLINEEAPSTATLFRSIFQGSLVVAGGFTRESGESYLQDNLADAIGYGRYYIANPDLDIRFAKDLPLNSYDRKTFYGGDEKGYIDYPTVDA